MSALEGAKVWYCIGEQKETGAPDLRVAWVTRVHNDLLVNLVVMKDGPNDGVAPTPKKPRGSTAPDAEPEPAMSQSGSGILLWLERVHRGEHVGEFLTADDRRELELMVHDQKDRAERIVELARRVEKELRAGAEKVIITAAEKDLLDHTDDLGQDARETAYTVLKHGRRLAVKV